MRVLNRNTEHAPLLMNLTAPKKYNAEEDNYQIIYDDKKQIVFYLEGGGCNYSGPTKRTESRRGTHTRMPGTTPDKYDDDARYVTYDNGRPACD